eukprot:6463880-Alexandrium_andersonii.AAC.1
MALAAQSGMSMFIIFVDIVSAFYSVSRAHVMPDAPERVDWQAVADALGMPDAVRQIARWESQAPGALH